MAFALVTLGLLLLSRSVPASAQCNSFGVDFQTGGTYFQNVSSTDDFTFVSTFSGCENDTADNILVDPNGDEYECTDTALQPDNTPELSTCPIEKDQLISGDWSILIISNNGNGDPIAYERDFSLVVGTPVTVTATPTVTVSITEIPTSTQTVYETDTETTCVTTKTTIADTVPGKTKTVRSTTTVTKTVAGATQHVTTRVVSPIYKTSYTTASCTIPQKQPHPDPWFSLKPTVVSPKAFESDLAKLIWGRSLPRGVPLNKEQRIYERKRALAARAAHVKRDIDQPTVTVPLDDTAAYLTTTLTVTASASVVQVTSETDITETDTATITVHKGTTVLPNVTVTATPSTTTKKKYTTTTVTVTTTKSPTVVVTSTVTPDADSCTRKGGSWW